MANVVSDNKVTQTKDSSVSLNANEQTVKDASKQLAFTKNCILQLEQRESLVSQCIELVSSLLMEEISSVCAKVHRKIKLCDICAVCLKKCNSLHNLSLSKSGVGSSGNISNGNNGNGNMKKANDNNEQFDCPHCKRPVVTSRFAPHLEKCMGMGRTSSRIKARQVNFPKETWIEGSDDDSDGDEASTERKRKKQSAAIPPTKKKKTEIDTFSPSLAARQILTPEQLSSLLRHRNAKSQEELAEFLQSRCGPPLANGKLCPRLTRQCTNHTDEQRYHVRQLLLLKKEEKADLNFLNNRSTSDVSLFNNSFDMPPNEYIDIDGVEDTTLFRSFEL